jgi:hypothetical protein
VLEGVVGGLGVERGRPLELLRGREVLLELLLLLEQELLGSRQDRWLRAPLRLRLESGERLRRRRRRSGDDGSL